MADYLKAFQLQDDWLRWMNTPEADEVWDSMERDANVFTSDTRGHIAQGKAYTRETRALYQRPLMYGECFYVDGRIVKNLRRMQDTMPAIPFTEDLMVSRFGFAMLADPIFLMRANWPEETRRDKTGSTVLSSDAEVVMDALGWMPSLGGVQFVGYQKLSMIDIHNNTIDRLIRERFGDMSPEQFKALNVPPDDERLHFSITADALLAERGRHYERPGFFPITHFNIGYGQTLADVVVDFEKVKETRKQLGHIQKDRLEEFIEVETGFSIALFVFMNDKRVRITRRPLMRSMKRHQEKRKTPLTDVNVILLRADEEAGFRHDDDPEPRDWDWQWPVREHMRFNRRTGKKDIHVSAYMKGPPDKPIKPRGRDIYLVAR